MKKLTTFEPVDTDIDKLKPHPQNYQEHPDDQVEHLMASIREHGLYRNVVVARDYTILAGHGVVKAARKMGFESIPVVRLDIAADDPRAMKLLVGDNEISHLSAVDDRALTNILREIGETAPDGLVGTGYDESMLAGLVYVTRTSSEITDFDAAKEWVGMPEFDAGPRMYRLNLRFRDEATLFECMDRLGLDKDEVQAVAEGHLRSSWWPVEENADLVSVRFEGGDEE